MGGSWFAGKSYSPIMSVLVIFNPISGAGRARAIADRVAAVGRGRGLEIDLLPTSPGFYTHRWLREPLQGRDAVVVVGGDGAVRLVAPEAARADVPLLHCPAGNENLFAREFGMKADPEFVARTLVDGSTRRVDLVRAVVEGREDETVVLMVSFGFDAEVVHDLTAVRTGAISNVSYLRPMLRQWRRLNPPRMTVKVDGEIVAHEVRGLAIVANSRQYAIRLDPARHARMDDGLVDLAILPFSGRFSLLGWLIRTRLGLHLRDPRTTYVTGRRVDFQIEQPSRWQVDGDPPHDPEGVRRITFEVIPGALAVQIPPET